MTYQEYNAAMQDLDEAMKYCTMTGLTDLFYATQRQQVKLMLDFWN